MTASTPSGTSALIRRLAALPWPWRIGLGVPLLAGAVLALGAAVSWVSGGYERPDKLEAGRIESYAPSAPKLFEEDDVWVVRLADGDFLALYDRGLESGCPLQWRRQFEFRDRRGWFVDACNGAAYDLTGRCFSAPCRGAQLDGFNVKVEGQTVVVDLLELIRVAAPNPDAEPITPQAE